MTLLAVVLFLLAAVPALLFFRNLRSYLPPPKQVAGGPLPSISVLVPARNEERNIRAALRSILANRGAELEVLVLDDHSTDSTAALVGEIAAADPRVRLIPAPELPSGWCGKVHACDVLSTRATHPLLVFVDADVRLSPDALARFAGFIEQSGCDLASGVPRQITGTLMEKLLIPLIHFVLLGFLPFDRMRRSTDPAYASAIGQLVIARREAYEASGGHAAIWNKVHDGLGLARLFRSCGLKTDLFDATETATCRMYERSADVWSGLGKNATEAMATPRLIVPCTLLLVGGQVLPLPFLLLTTPGTVPFQLLVAAVLLSAMLRVVSIVRFKQSGVGAFLHPLGVLLLVTIQWQALAAKVLGRPARWKGRLLQPAPSG